MHACASKRAKMLSSDVHLLKEYIPLLHTLGYDSRGDM